jgi:hypothetical protein
VLNSALERISDRAYFELASPVWSLGGATLASFTPEGQWILNRADWGEWWMDWLSVAVHHRVQDSSGSLVELRRAYLAALKGSERELRWVDAQGPELMSLTEEQREDLKILGFIGGRSQGLVYLGDGTKGPAAWTLDERHRWAPAAQRRRRGSQTPCESIRSALLHFSFEGSAVPMECRELKRRVGEVLLSWPGLKPDEPKTLQLDAPSMIYKLGTIHRRQWRPDEIKDLVLLLESNPAFVADFDEWIEQSVADLQLAFQNSLKKSL